MDPRMMILESLLGNLPGGLVHVEQGSPLNDIVKSGRRNADSLDEGDKMLLDCLAELTKHCLAVIDEDKESDDLPTTVAELNDKNVSRYFVSGTFAMAADRLGQKYLLPWLNSACRDLVARAIEDGKDTVEEIAGAILTGVMHGKIASPIVTACGLPLTGLALSAAAGLQKLVTVVGAERVDSLLKADMNEGLDTLAFNKRACLRLTANLQRSNLLMVLAAAKSALMAIQLYLVDGDRELAHHNVWVIETALGLRDKPSETDAAATGNGHDADEQPKQVRIDDMEGEVYLAGTEPASLRNREPASVN